MWTILKNNQTKIFEAYQKIFFPALILYLIDYSFDYLFNHSKASIFLPVIAGYVIISPLICFVLYKQLKGSTIQEFPRFLYSVIITNILADLMVFIGFLLLVFPGIYIAFRLKFITFYIIDYYETLNPIEIVKKCYKEGPLYPFSELILFSFCMAILNVITNCTIDYLAIFVIPLEWSCTLILYQQKRGVLYAKSEDNNTTIY